MQTALVLYNLAALCLWFGARFQSYLLRFPPSHYRRALNRRFLIFAGLRLGVLMSDYFAQPFPGELFTDWEAEN